MNIRILLLSLAALVSFFTVVSCNKNDGPAANLPPSSFIVTAKQATTGNDVVLTWTKAKDPNGNFVTYTVFSKDTLIRRLFDTTYTIKNVGYGKTVAGTVVAVSSQKASTPATFTIAIGAEPFVDIPDVNFEMALIDLKIDSAKDGKLRVSEALKVTSLAIQNKSISNLQGIQAFAKLKILDCSSNNLSSLDLTQNTAITKLYCNANKLTSLDMSNNTSLVELDCSVNKLTSLDVSNNTFLTSLGCSKNNLTKLDMSNNTNLTKLHCTNNNLINLDVSKNKTLSVLWCFSNSLGNLDLSKNPVLKVMQCFGNSIQIICVADLNKVTTDWAKDISATYQVCK